MQWKKKPQVFKQKQDIYEGIYFVVAGSLAENVKKSTVVISSITLNYV